MHAALTAPQADPVQIASRWQIRRSYRDAAKGKYIAIVTEYYVLYLVPSVLYYLRATLHACRCKDPSARVVFRATFCAHMHAWQA
jgi:hypothetical protein